MSEAESGGRGAGVTEGGGGVVLEVERVTKKFPGVTALKDVNFDLRAGEIHALCGENGAGKSTLIKLLSGIHPYGSYEGRIVAGGSEARFGSVADAERAGIAVIYQELALVNEMSVAENIFLGSEPRNGLGLIDWPRIYSQARLLLERFRLEIDPARKTGQLGVGQKQLVEIVKALSKQSRILILDEPTAALSEQEVVILIEILKSLRAEGIACIYISHKLDEVFALADRVTVLRDGSTISTSTARETSQPEVIRRMVGREIEDLFPRRASRKGEIVLEVGNLSVADKVTGREILKDLSFQVRAGEVLGIGGLMGAGRTELLMHLFGAWGERRSGKVLLRGRPLPENAGPAEVVRRGLVLVSEDRRRYGLILDKTLGFNFSLSSLFRLTRGGLIDEGREYRESEGYFQALNVKASGLEAIAGKLSGGNQQKVVIGKALMTGAEVIFLDEPTRGIDVGAKVEIYGIINRLTDEGKGVVLVSSELPELIGMSDRILMLREGRMGGEFLKAEVTQEKLMEAAITSKM